MVAITAIFAVIGYASSGYKFFDQISTLTEKEFADANSLLQDIHLKVTYQADKTLVGRIDAKFERFQDFQSRWGTLDNQTLEAFATEILEGDGSIDNAIRRFHNSVYASGGYFEANTNKIFRKHKLKWWEKILPTRVPSFLIREDLLKFFPTLVEVEMRATTLIFFGYYLERQFSENPNQYATEIELAKSKHEERLTVLKSKIDELFVRVNRMRLKEDERNYSPMPIPLNN